MQIRQLTALTVLAAMGMLVGCGTEEPSEPADLGDTSYNEDRTDQAPPPESSVPDTGERAGGDLAGNEPMDRPATEPATPGTQPGTAGQDTGQDVGMTEFAALDTDADGKLAESEWQPDAVEGMEFEQIDEDSSGDIDREEFRQAMAMSDQGTGQQEMNPDQESGTP